MPIALQGGGGKGGGGSSRPQEEPNSLRSRTRVKVLYLLSEGEIEGLGPEPLKNVYFDNVPVVNPDGRANFKDVTLDWRSGTNFQSVIDGFTDVAAEIQVGVKCTASGGPIVRTLNDPNADAVTIRLGVSSLQLIDEAKGDVKSTSVAFRIGLSIDGGPEYPVVDSAITGKTTGPYERSYRIPLAKPGTNYRISVTRTTPDSTSARVQDELTWASYTSIIDVPLTYPNSALLAIGLNGEQFRTVPKVGVKGKGTKYQIPSNYNPVTRAYTGLWDGTFVTAWTNNPAWVLYNLMIRDRDGVGRLINSTQIDKWSLYQIGQYCDQFVPDGFGGVEPRFVINCYISNADDAYNVLNALAAVFRGMVYWGDGTAIATQDRPWTTTSKFYGEENVIVEVDDRGNVTKPPFNYSGSSAKTRHTVALVSYRDKNDFHKQKIEAVEDQAGLAKYGYRETSIDAFGCDSRGQARRVGLWYLYTNGQETETLTFTIGSDGLLTRPGEVIKVADPIRSGERRTGRIVEANSANVILDVRLADLNLPSGVILSMIHPGTGQAFRVPALGWTAAGNGLALFSFATLPFSPIVATPWMITSDNLIPEQWRVFSVSEKNYQYTISCTQYRPDKFNAIEYGWVLEPLPTTTIGDITRPPNPPAALTIREQLYESRAAGVRVRADVGWTKSPSSAVVSYRSEYRDVSSNAWLPIGDSSEFFATIDDIAAGVYAFRVQAVNRLGLRSDWTQVNQEIYGLTVPPVDVADFTAVPIDRQIQLRWAQQPDLDVRVGGYFVLKFTPKTTAASWIDGFEVARIPGSATSHLAPLQAGTYMIRAEDTTGNQSVNATFAPTGQIVALATNILATIDEAPLFLGVKTGTVEEGGILRIAANNLFDVTAGLFDTQSGLFDAGNAGAFDSGVGLIDSQSGLFDGTAPPNLLAGSYDFFGMLDLGAVYVSRINAILSARVVANNAYFDSPTTLFDSQGGLFEQTDSSQGTAVLQIATSLDGSAYSAWQAFTPGDYTARAFRFRLLLTVEVPTVNVFVDRLSVSIDMPDRTETGIANNSVVFARPFLSLQLLSIDIIGAAPGDYVTLTSQTVSGFTVQLFNGSNQPINKTFTWIARGFGYKV